MLIKQLKDLSPVAFEALKKIYDNEVSAGGLIEEWGDVSVEKMYSVFYKLYKKSPSFNISNRYRNIYHALKCINESIKKYKKKNKDLSLLPVHPNQKKITDIKNVKYAEKLD